AYHEFVAEALWLKGNAYELVGDKQKARETYSRLVTNSEYKNTEWVKLAKERLKKLGGIMTPAAPPAQ
ncbi:tol-pal system YbgF family protein, partial [Verrucomicrobiota bacterium]